MKKLNITKKQFSESKYFTTKYGKLEYVSESGKFYKTDKGNVLKFVKESKNLLNEGSGEFCTVEIKGLMFKVIDYKFEKGGKSKVTAEVVPGDYEISAKSYGKKDLFMREHKHGITP